MEPPNNILITFLNNLFFFYCKYGLPMLFMLHLCSFYNELLWLPNGPYITTMSTTTTTRSSCYAIKIWQTNAINISSTKSSSHDDDDDDKHYISHMVLTHEKSPVLNDIVDDKHYINHMVLTHEKSPVLNDIDIDIDDDDDDDDDGAIDTSIRVRSLEVGSKAKAVPRVWPLPLHFSSSHHNSTTNTTVTTSGKFHHPQLMVLLSQHLQFHYYTINSSNVIMMEECMVVKNSSTYNTSPVLDEAFKRYVDIIFGNHDGGDDGDGDDVHQFDNHMMISTLCINLKSMDESLHLETDESYSLQVPHSNNPNLAYIEADTIYGALRGLETFSQLCSFDFESKSVKIRDAPWSISDKPRFRYRGLLVDTARHYQPIRVIKKVLDAMSYAKLNVFHWHIVDTQSFALEIPSFPNLSHGSYSIHERYTIDDAKDIVEYARRRGIHVLPEIDVPGHAASWGVGYPELWPSVNCTQPLDVSRNFTFHVINGILSDFAKIFKFGFVHMGGDEVNTSCWTSTPRIRSWLNKNNLTAFDAYKSFVLRAEAISLSHGFIPINWEEPFNRFGDQLNKKTVIQNWLQSGIVPKVVKSGFKCIVSSQDVWYLDHLDVTWPEFYMNEPLTNITDDNEQNLVLGGEVCMWGETVDPSDIEQTIWPRAAAAAERLWSSLDRIALDPRDAMPRLRHFRCLLNQRGIAAAPVEGYGRSTPFGPGSCYSQ